LSSNRPTLICGAPNIAALQAKLVELIQTTNDGKIVRIFIPSLEHLYQDGDAGSTSAICKFLLYLKHFIRNRRVSITCLMHRASLPNQAAAVEISQVADSVLVVDSFAGRLDAIPSEFREFVGFLSILKHQQQCSLASHRAAYERYGLKRNRRKLAIEPLHLPPEESRAFGSAGTDEHLKLKAEAQKLSASSSVGPTPRIELKLEQPASTPPPPPQQQQREQKSTDQAASRKKSLADSLAAARLARQAMKNQAAGTTPAPACAQPNLDF
jgi:hypothetical protein